MPSILSLDHALTLTHEASATLATLRALAVPGVSTGEVRPITGWAFERDQVVRGKPLAHAQKIERDQGHVLCVYHLGDEGYYLADGFCDRDRTFCYMSVFDHHITILEREAMAEVMFTLQGVEELREALRLGQWQKAWELCHYAAHEDALLAKQELVAELKRALAALTEPELAGRPGQTSWATQLRARAIGRLRGLYLNFCADPARPGAHPRLHYALLTAAFFMKSAPHARTFIAADYHIQRADIAELVDRFANNGRKRYNPRGRAQCLTQQDLELLRRLTHPPR